MPKRELGKDECRAAYQRAAYKRTALIGRIKLMKARGEYNHEAVKLLLQVTRKISNARGKLLDNYWRSYYIDQGFTESKQSYFIDRAQGRVK